MNFVLTSKEYGKIKNQYDRYIVTYKMMNNGSQIGATSLNNFYLYWTYTLKYNQKKYRTFIDIR